MTQGRNGRSAVRRRRGLRQCDVAAMAGVGPLAVSAVGKGPARAAASRAIAAFGPSRSAMPFAPAVARGGAPQIGDARTCRPGSSEVVARLAPLGWRDRRRVHVPALRRAGLGGVLGGGRSSALCYCRGGASRSRRPPADALGARPKRFRLVPGCARWSAVGRAATLGVFWPMNEASTSRYQVGRSRRCSPLPWPGGTPRSGAGSRTPAPRWTRRLRWRLVSPTYVRGTLIGRRGEGRRARDGCACPETAPSVTATRRRRGAKGSLVAAEGPQ